MTVPPDDPRPSSAAAPAWPSVTVVVPTHNRPEPMRRAVQAALDQDYPAGVDVLVVFDKSEPHQPDVTLRPGRRVRVLTNSCTPGLAGARNTGLGQATGDLVAFCDDDDEWLPGKLRAQVRLLSANPDAQVVGCGIVLQHGPERLARATPPSPVTYDQLLASRVAELHPSTFLARRAAVLDEIGLVDEAIPGSYCEDYDWLLRAARLHPVLMVEEPFVVVMWQTGSLFANRWATIIDALEFLLRKHPDLAAHPAGAARIEGQIAFAHAALGHGPAARHWAGRAIRHSVREQRAYLAVAVSLHLLTVERVHALAHRRGRGI